MERPLRDVAGVVLLVALLLVAACSRSPDPQEIAVIPATSIVPLTGGAGVPDPARVLLVDADRRLRAGDYEGAIVAANEAEARLSAPSSAPPTRTPTSSPRATTTPSPTEAVRAVAAVYRKLALVNLHRTGEALHAADCARVAEAVAGDIRSNAVVSCYTADASAYLQDGDAPGAAEAIRRTEPYLTGPAPEALGTLCAAAEEQGADGACRPVAARTEPSTTTSGPPATRGSSTPAAPGGSTPASRSISSARPPISPPEATSAPRPTSLGTPGEVPPLVAVS